MSSSHIVIIARNELDGRVELPLGDLTLYGVGDEEEMLKTAAKAYGLDWTLALYHPVVHTIMGGTKGQTDAKR